MPQVQIDDISMHYQLHGQGAPVLLIMGFVVGREVWEPQIEDLCRDFHICSFDNRGIGKTDTPPPPYSMPRMAQDTLGLMDHLGWADAHVVGFSMGGMIAQHLALSAPERVRTLSLISTHAGGWTARPPLALFARCADPFICKTEEDRHVRAIQGNLSAAYIERVGIDSLLQRIEETPFEPMTWNGIFGQTAAIFTHRTHHRLSALQDIPTQVICGDADRVIRPANSERLAQILGITPSMLPGGHGITIEQAEAVNQLLREHFRGAEQARAAEA